jgi:hypothetical protein
MFPVLAGYLQEDEISTGVNESLLSQMKWHLLSLEE